MGDHPTSKVEPSASGSPGLGSHDGWVYQGRKEHGYFGDGTKPNDGSKPDTPAPDEALVPRGTSIATVVRASIAEMPPAQRARDEAFLGARHGRTARNPAYHLGARGLA